MRPGQIRPGNIAHPALNSPSPSKSFNEARADSPGKYTLSEVLARPCVAVSIASGSALRGTQDGFWIPSLELSSS